MADSQPPAGWYPDPQGAPGRLRYWDGATWTADVAATQAEGGAPNPAYVAASGSAAGPEQSRADEVYTEKGGLRFGSNFWVSVNWTWPYAAFRADRQAITVSVPVLLSSRRRTFEFPREAIVSLVPMQVLFSPGIRIEHRNPDYPPYIVYWSFSPRAVREALERLGYQVATSEYA